MTFPTTHIHIPSPRNALTKIYQFQHYSEFQYFSAYVPKELVQPELECCDISHDIHTYTWKLPKMQATT